MACTSALHSSWSTICWVRVPLPLAAVAERMLPVMPHCSPPLPLTDYQGTTASLGKPSMADMRLGLATAPVLFAAQRYPVLLPIIERKFDAPGDIETALKCVAAADGLTATRRLAVAHGQMAVDALSTLRPSAARTALASLVTRVLSRDH